MIQLPDKALIGMVHLPALPGAARWSGDLSEVIGRAARESMVLKQAGFDMVIVENFGDAPFRAATVEPHTVAAMILCVEAVVEACGLPAGVNVLRNDPFAALAIASVGGARAIRVNVHMGVYATDQGFIEGRAAETLLYRQRLGADVEIWADVHVKHARPLHQPDIALAAEELIDRGQADAVIVSGDTTGRPADMEDIKRVKAAVGKTRVLVGSGVTAANVKQHLEHCDGVIVGSDLKPDGKASNALCPDRVDSFVEAARG